MSQIARLASYGGWLNLFLCNATVSGVKEQFGPNPTGVTVNAARCHS
jgi:phospholipid/cholesterol/gamma-HCH transport system substrate-binding protein